MEELMAVLNPKPKKRHAPRLSRDSRGRFLKRGVTRMSGRTNPKHKAKRHSKRRPYRKNPFVLGSVAANPKRHHYRRNPRPALGALIGEFTGALVGAGGGIAVDAAMRPLPLEWKSGAKGYLARGTASVLLGVVGSFLRGRAGNMLAAASRGALTITVYNAARQYVTVPMGLGELSDDEVSQILENPSPVVYDQLPNTMPDEGMSEYTLGDTPVYEDYA